MTPGFISTIITVRNGEAFVREAIDSLLTQSADQHEVIVVSDGSTDATNPMLAEYADPRLTVIVLPYVGRISALLRAVAASRGEFIAILDADDVALPHRLHSQRAYLTVHPEVALVGSRAIEFDGVSERTPPAPHGPKLVRRALGMYNPFYFSSLMFRRTVYNDVGGFRPEDGWAYDKAFIIRVAVVHPVDIINEPLIRYRRHTSQVSASATWEQLQRPRSASLQLKAAWQLNLPPHLWIYPLLGGLYAWLPCGLRPRRWKRPTKEWLLRKLGIWKS
jgi:glycosyltransferase involved in cell wall biosynthesis